MRDLDMAICQRSNGRRHDDQHLEHHFPGVHRYRSRLLCSQRTNPVVASAGKDDEDDNDNADESAESDESTKSDGSAASGDTTNK